MKQRERLLESIERIAHIGGWQWDVPGDRLTWSDEVYRILGRVPGQSSPRHADFLAAVHPDDRSRVEQAVAASITHKAPWDIGFRIVRPDGSERAVHSSAELALDQDGEVAAMTGTVHDVTDQRNATERLAASERRFRLLIEDAPDGVLLYDADRDRFATANKAAERLFACGREEIVSRSPRHFFAAEQPDGQPVASSFAEHTGRALDGEQVKFERMIVNSAGEKRVCEVTLVHLPFEGRRLVRASFVDVTGQRASLLALQKFNRSLLVLNRVNEVASQAVDEISLYRGACHAVAAAGGYGMVWIGTVEHDSTQSISPVAWAGAAGASLGRVQAAWAEGWFGNETCKRAAGSGEPQVAATLPDGRRPEPLNGAHGDCGFRSVAALPLKNGAVFALLAIYSDEPDAFDADTLCSLRELATDLSHGVRALREQARREAAELRWRGSLEAAVGAIASTVEMRDAYTAGHQERVARLAVAIARELGMPQDQVHGLHLTAIVHDVGKIRIPAEILSKPSRLSKLEFQLIQLHAEAGYEILRNIDFPWPIAEIVRQHHERLDGSGYPRGLAGQEILLEAGILAVADVVEAMMSHRPYRPALGIDAALSEIEAGMGRLYDKAAVQVCIALFRQKGWHF